MAEYIDRNLIEWYGCDFENASCENRERSGCSHAECSHSQVMQIPKADVIELKPILEEYDSLHNNDNHLTNKQIDDWCIKTMRKILSDYYAENIGE